MDWLDENIPHTNYYKIIDNLDKKTVSLQFAKSYDEHIRRRKPSHLSTPMRKCKFLLIIIMSLQLATPNFWSTTLKKHWTSKSQSLKLLLWLISWKKHYLAVMKHHCNLEQLNIWWTLSYGAKHVWKFLQFPTLIRYCETDNGEINSNILVHHFLVAKWCQEISTFLSIVSETLEKNPSVVEGQVIFSNETFWSWCVRTLGQGMSSMEDPWKQGILFLQSALFKHGCYTG